MHERCTGRRPVLRPVHRPCPLSQAASHHRGARRRRCHALSQISQLWQNRRRRLFGSKVQEERLWNSAPIAGMSYRRAWRTILSPIRPGLPHRGPAGGPARPDPGPNRPGASQRLAWHPQRDGRQPRAHTRWPHRAWSRRRRMRRPRTAFTASGVEYSTTKTRASARLVARNNRRPRRHRPRQGKWSAPSAGRPCPRAATAATAARRFNLPCQRQILMHD